MTGCVTQSKRLRRRYKYHYHFLRHQHHKFRHCYCHRHLHRNRQKFQHKTISNLHNYQGVAQRRLVAEDTFPVETNTHYRMLCHLMSRRVLGRMDNCPQQRSEHHLVQTLYTDSDNDMSRRCRDPGLEKK